MNIIETDIVIIGAGPIGLYSAFYCGMSGFNKCHIIESLDTIGGQCSALYADKPIINLPGIYSVNAIDLIGQLYKQSQRFEHQFHLNTKVVNVEKSNDSRWILKTNNNTGFITKVVIIAIGAGAFSPVKIPLHNAIEFENKSLFYSVSDRKILKDKRLLIIGGGDQAIDWVLELYNDSEIHLIHRRNKFRACPDNVKKIEELSANGKIKLYTPFQIDKIYGDNGIVSNVTIKSPSITHTIDIDFIFPCLGMMSEASTILDCGITTEKNKIIIDPTTAKTNLDGIYSVGDCVTYNNKFNIILSGFSEAFQAAQNIKVYLSPDAVFDQKSLYGWEWE